jgi:hypothetical protein
LEDGGVDGRIILRWIFKKRDGEARTGSIGRSIGTGFCDRCNEPLGSIKCGEFLFQFREFLASQEGICCMELVN